MRALSSDIRNSSVHWALYASGGLQPSELQYSAPFLATLHPTYLRCTFELRWIPLNYSLHPTELSCILLIFIASFFWTMLQPQRYTAHSELCSTLLSYATFFWATLHPTEQCQTLQRSTAPWCATLHKLSFPPPHCIMHPTDAAPFWATPHLLRNAAPY
jgi:hypothetical protein